ncbi:hypothetical protein RHMOL_Rhmol12G0115300 [Rhododendron molle]|uniref:Uncharacterized protein n=1 Tax=Rhododendron molle TaxID=49168 RepID=A0ACC0LII1_RHOML|nr:hypothetical protein RHMOL_Rhmol12G0115300 [Rhododendron molle]
MLHANTNRLILILINTVLEWILIIILLSSKHPAPGVLKLATSSIPQKVRIPTEIFCQSHAKEISQAGYCSNHQKLAQSHDMCEDCSSSQPNNHGMSKTLSLFPWLKRVWNDSR